MAKVEGPDGAIPFFNPALYGHVKKETQGTKEREKLRGIKRPAFLDILGREVEGTEAIPDFAPSEEVLQELLDGVHSSGDDLKKRPFPEEIKKYKAAVRNFMHYVVENGFTVETREGLPNYLKPRVQGKGRNPADAQNRKIYNQVQVVDQKLEQLAAEILRGQSKQLDLIARIDEINGLLVNMLQ